MKKQTFQFILGFFLIFSAFPAFSAFLVESGFKATSSGSCQQTREAACSTLGSWVPFVSSACVGNQPSGDLSNYCRKSGSCTTASISACPLSPTIEPLATCTIFGSRYSCECNQGTYENTSTGLISTTTSCTPNYATPSDDILAYAIGAGLFSGGTAAALASCTFGVTPTCIASAVSALAGAGLALNTYLSSGDSSPVAASPDPCAGKTCISVQIDPSKPITGADNFISRDSNGNLKPEGSGWTNNGDGKFSTSVTDGTVTVDTVSDRVTSTVTNSNGTFTSSLQSGNYSGSLEFTAQGQNLETSYTQQFTGSFSGQGVQQSQKQSSSGTSPSGWNYNGAIAGGGTGDTGGGTGSGTGTGTGTGGGDCQTYGCAKETTQQQVLDSLKGGGGIDHAAQGQAASDSVSAGLESLIGDYQGQIQSKVDEIMNDSTVKDLFDQLGDFNPLNATSSNCSIESNLFGKQLNLSYCEEQPTIHLILSFIFFVWFVFAVTNLILERNH